MTPIGPADLLTDGADDPGCDSIRHGICDVRYRTDTLGSVTEDAVSATQSQEHKAMNNIIWIVGAIVIVLFILGFLGLR